MKKGEASQINRASKFFVFLLFSVLILLTLAAAGGESAAAVPVEASIPSSSTDTSATPLVAGKYTPTPQELELCRSAGLSDCGLEFKGPREIKTSSLIKTDLTKEVSCGDKEFRESLNLQDGETITTGDGEVLNALFIAKSPTRCKLLFKGKGLLKGKGELKELVVDAGDIVF